MKPNYKTSEFWFTVVTFIFSALFLLGFLTDYDQKEDLISDVSHGVESVFLIGGQLAVLYKYINSRKKEKVAYQNRQLEKVQEIAEELEEYVGVDEDDKINLNTATLGDLIRLPNIGPATAKKIIEYRGNTPNGFVHTKELVHINGIGQNRYNELEKYVTI